jgi:hypothetical protein
MPAHQSVIVAVRPVLSAAFADAFVGLVLLLPLMYAFWRLRSRVDRWIGERKRAKRPFRSVTEEEMDARIERIVEKKISMRR